MKGLSLSEFGVQVTLDSKSLKIAVDTLKQLPRDVVERIEKQILKKAMQPVFNEVMTRVPVGEEGNLAKGIRLRVKKAGTRYIAEVVSTAFHSHLVEFGHRIIKGTYKKGNRRISKNRVPPHPFLQPSFNAHAENILKICEDEINLVLAKRGLK